MTGPTSDVWEVMSTARTAIDLVHLAQPAIFVGPGSSKWVRDTHRPDTVNER